MLLGRTGIAIGETVVGNIVTISQGLTLGGTGKDRGDRHPKVCNNTKNQRECVIYLNELKKLQIIRICLF